MKKTVNGVALNYTVEGNGPWLVMSHALGCDHRMWDGQAAWLSRHFTVLRYDIRGHGQSDAPPGPYTLELLADDVARLLDAVGATRAHWLGLSLGGMIGQAFVLNYPERVENLALADTSSRYPPETVAVWEERIRTAREKGMTAIVDATLERWFTAPYRAAHPDIMQRIGDMIRQTSVEGYAACGRAIATLDYTDRLRAVRCPTLVLVGEEDPGTPPAMARAIQEAIPGAQLALIPSAAHLSNIEQQRAFDEALARFYGVRLET